MNAIVKEWLYPEGDKQDTLQIRSPIYTSESDSNEEEWAPQTQVDRLQGQGGPIPGNAAGRQHHEWDG